MIAALYVRVSSEEQLEGYSIAAQVSLLTEYCTKNAISIYKIYTDEGVSAFKEKQRPQFLKLVDDAEKHLFDVVLVHKYDRFSRLVELSRATKSRLKKLGINVLSITEPIEDSPIGFFQETLLEALAEYYSRNLSAETKKGMNERVKSGAHMGCMPFGYKVLHGRVTVDEQQAEIVRHMYKLYLNGWGILKIRNWLDSNNIKGQRNGDWTVAQVKRILRNVKYIGKQQWNGKIYDADFPSIVPLETFNRVQQGIGENKEKYTYRGSNYDKFVLLGLLRCGICGAPMRVKAINTGKDTKYLYYGYVCSSAAQAKSLCIHTRIFRTHDLEKKIFEIIHSISPGLVMELDIQGENKANVKELFQERSSRIDKAILRAKEAYLTGVFSLEEFKATKDRLENEKAVIQMELSKGDCDGDNNAHERIPSHIKNVYDMLISLNSPLERKKLLMTFIKCIVVYPDKIHFDFYVQ
ncbi:MAG: recombinase family protein [Clostridia bacterium]|nr:recombinase family protein [Clostridia bacterium]